MKGGGAGVAAQRAAANLSVAQVGREQGERLLSRQRGAAEAHHLRQGERVLLSAAEHAL